MSWKEKCIVRILLIISKIVNDDPIIARDIDSLHCHIAQGGEK